MDDAFYILNVDGVVKWVAQFTGLMSVDFGGIVRFSLDSFSHFAHNIGPVFDGSNGFCVVMSYF